MPPLVYSSSRMGFHYTFSFPRSQSGKRTGAVDAGFSLFAAPARQFSAILAIILNQ